MRRVERFKSVKKRKKKSSLEMVEMLAVCQLEAAKLSIYCLRGLYTSL